MNTEFDCLHSVSGRVVAGGAANKPQTSFRGFFFRFASVFGRITKLFKMSYRTEQRGKCFDVLGSLVLTMKEETLNYGKKEARKEYGGKRLVMGHFQRTHDL